MGKKYFKRKHRGVKDPLDHQRKKEIEKKPNRRPQDPTKQEIPRKLRELSQYFDMQGNKMKTKGKNKIKRGKNGERPLYIFDQDDGDDEGLTRHEKKIPDLIQEKSESDKQFLRRVYMETEKIKTEAEFEQRYGYEVETEDGEMAKVVGIALGTKHTEKLQIQAKKRKEKNKEKKKVWQDKTTVLKEKKKEKMEEKNDEFYKKDTFIFGETVSAPPKLQTAKLDKRKEENSSKSKNFLFMKKYNKKNDTEETVARKRVLEEEREKALHLYRNMKAAKRHKVSLDGENW